MQYQLDAADDSWPLAIKHNSVDNWMQAASDGSGASQDESAVVSAVPFQTAGNFDPGDFLAYLDEQGVHEAVLAFTGNKRKAVVLYSRFMSGPNFMPWLQRLLGDKGIPPDL